MNKLLLHTCCGPCAGGVIPELEDFSLSGFFYNPNIFPTAEAQKRLEGAQSVFQHFQKPLLVPETVTVDFAGICKVNNRKPARCLLCYELRLRKTVEYAAEHHFSHFSTTLLLSPYQYHRELRDLGRKLGVEHRIVFLEEDFRSRFRASGELASQLGLYRQKYCGCKFSRKRR